MSNTATIKVALKIDEKGAVRGFRNIGKESNATGEKGTRAFKKMDRSADALNRSMKMTTATIAKMGTGVTALVGAAGIGGLSLMAQRTMEATVEIEKNSQMAGISTRAYQELTYAAGKYHVSTDALTDGLKELNLRAEEFVFTGAGPGQEAFQRLGYSQDELNRKLKNTPALLSEIVRRMEGMGTAAKMRIADEIFGGQGGEQFVSLINGGAKALENFKNEASQMGIIMDEGMIQKSIQAKAEVTRLTTVLGGQFNILVAELAPDIRDVATNMTDWVTANREFISQNIKSAMDTARDGVSGIYGALKDVKNLFDSIPGEITGAAGTGLLGAYFFGGKIGLVIGALTMAENLSSKVGMGMGDLVKTQKEGMEIRKQLLDSLGMKETDYFPEDGLERFYKAMGIVKKEINETTKGYDRYKGIFTFPIGKNTPGYDQYVKGPDKPESPKSSFSNDELTAMRIQAIQDEEQARTQATHEEIQAMNAMVAKEKEIYTWLTETSVNSRIEAIQTEEAEISASWQRRIEAENAMVALEKEIYTEFQDAYKQATMSSTEYQLAELQKRYDEYANHIEDKARLEKWFAAESKRIMDDSSSDWSDAFAGWANSFSSDLTDMVWGADLSFSNIAESFGRMLTQMYIQKKVMEPLMDWGFGGSTSDGAIGGMVTDFSNGTFDPFNMISFHTGGVAGSGEGGVKTGVDPRVFVGASKHHTGYAPPGLGLSPGEVPAIIKDDEGVFTQGQMAAIGRGLSRASQVTAPPQVHVNVHNHASDTKARVEQSDDGQSLDIIIEQVEGAMTGRINRGDGMASFLDSRYGRRM